jgi:hypothetical protein
MGWVTLTRWGRRRRGAAIALATVLAVAAVAAMLAAVAWASPRLEFIHIQHNLSQTGERVSAYPDLAVSPDGDRVVVVWTEKYDEQAGYRGHVYLRAASESGGGWGNRIPVFTGGSSACAYYRAAVAVTDTTAHVAYVVFDNTCLSPNFTRVHYVTCSLSLTGGECGDGEQVAFAATSNSRITWVDLSLDTDGNPHVVWAEYFKDPVTHEDLGRIRYKARVDGGWGDTEYVYSTGDNNVPAIAWANRYAHVVWQKEWQGASGQDMNDILYRRRSVNGEWDPSGGPLVLLSADEPQRNPKVAAGGTGRVFVVWDRCLDDNCDKYALLYKRSDTNGAGLPYGGFGDYREVGTGQTGLDNLKPYTPTGNGYLPDLQPSIALNRDGWPTVVSHAAYSTDTYAIYYSYATTWTTGTVKRVSWITPTVLVEGQLGAAVVGVGESEPGGGQHIHVAYMESNGSAWDVYYDSNEWNSYEHLYMPLIMRSG